MSTVLWSNILIDGVVQSDQVDKYALYKFTNKLDQLSKKLGEIAFSDLLDSTDATFNLSQDELPDGMTSTDELMADRGIWVSGDTAALLIKSLIQLIKTQNIRFGLLTNQAQNVIDELEDALVLANNAKALNGKFNFAVVM